MSIDNNIIVLQDGQVPFERSESTGLFGKTVPDTVVPVFEPLSQQLTIPATPIFPQTVSSSGNVTTGSGTFDMTNFQRATFFITVGTISGSGVVNPKLQASPDGGIWTDITNYALTGISSSNKCASLEITQAQMPTNKPMVRCYIGVDNNNCVVGCLPLGYQASYEPTSLNDISAVVQRLFN